MGVELQIPEDIAPRDAGEWANHLSKGGVAACSDRPAVENRIGNVAILCAGIGNSAVLARHPKNYESYHIGQVQGRYQPSSTGRVLSRTSSFVKVDMNTPATHPVT